MIKSANTRFLSSILIFSVIAVVLAALTPLSYSDYPSPAQQIRDGVSPEDIQCNENRVHVIRSNGAHVCVTERTAERMGWEIVLAIETKPSEKTAIDDVILETKENDEFTVLNPSSPVEFVDDGREIKRSTLQKAPAPWPMHERIMDSQINPNNIDSDGLVRVPSIPHEKYSVNPRIGFYPEDWFPTHILDGQKLLYAETECHPSGDCGLTIQYIPTTFVLHENVTNHDLDVSKGFMVGVRYSVEPLDEIEDNIEYVKEIFDSQPGNYGKGFVNMTRDGKTIFAYEGGNILNHYQSVSSFHFDEHTSFGVVSNYHTLDELLPVFSSIGN